MDPKQTILDRCRPWRVGAGAPAVAIDVGGTSIKAALIDQSGAVVDAASHPTPPAGREAPRGVVDSIAHLLTGFRENRTDVRPERTSVTIPGIVSEDDGIGVLSANLGWADVDFGTLLRDTLGATVLISHDVRASGRAEFSLLANTSNAVMITIGTGISAAIQVNGQLLSGRGYAGEIGLVPVTITDDAGLTTIPLEAVSSAASIARRYAALSGERATGALEVIRARDAGDTTASTVWNQAVDCLAQACEQAVALIAPETIILGGGLAEDERLGCAVAAALARRLGPLPSPEVRSAQLGFVAGLLGAGLRARCDEHPGEKPSIELASTETRQ
ncbi:ROK family protein [Tsukamurella tyrosinosolvens]|uniref:ROK family protein n=1 Tax=Tsukamurella tyrosinosolvens TaxID=57704 RepID=UPI0015F17B99|nr:ROK family protein [Tsukamurella tyrosinosolvens]